jgi:hypothetical protein
MTAMTDRLTSKRTVLVLVLVAASVILVSGAQEWVSGSVDDVVLGSGVLHGKGSDVAPGAQAAALVGLASAVVTATSGRVARLVAACSGMLAAVLGATVVILVLVDPGGALGSVAAVGTGRSGTLVAHSRAEGWAWGALAAMLVLGVGSLGALVGRRHWHGLSSRYDAGEPAARHPSAASPVSAWDQLSRGEDPTAER